MKKILYIIMAMLSLSAVSPQVVFAQEVDDLQEYLDQLAAKAERSRNARAAVPLATETEIDLSRFSSYKNRTAVLKFAASLNVRITNGTITAASNFSGGTPLVEVNGTVTLDASASIDASSVSSSVCTAAVGVKGTGTFNQYAAVIAPRNGEKVTLESASCTWNNYFDVADPDFEGSDCLEYTYDTTNKTASVKIYSSTEYSGDIVIPKKVKYNGETYSVTSIGDIAFCKCSSLTSITIPNSVTTIGSEAFICCWSLTSITIPNSVTNIGSTLFIGCSSLVSIVVEEGNTKYDSREGCNAIIETSTNTLISGCKKTVIPTSVTCIGNHSFSGCSNLTTITIPSSVTCIGDGAFGDCSGLTSIIIPNSVTSIGNEAFSFCRSLALITLPNGLTSIGNMAFVECSSLTSITIPNSVTSIGDNAFLYCSNLTSVTIPNGVISIGASAFGYCWRLTSLTIPNSVNSIGERVFSGCSSLTSIALPASVTTIGYSAFEDCKSLTDVTNYATTPQSITPDVFTSYGTLHVPAGCKSAYQAADGWKNFTIVEMEPEIGLADINVMLAKAKGALDEVNDILARTKAVYGEVKELIPAEQAASIDKYLADADVASAKFKQSYDGLVAAVSVATSAQYAALYASASELNDAITAFGEGLVSYEIEVVNGLIESGQKALATKLAVLKQGIVGLEAAVSNMQANAALEKRRCGTDFFMVDPAVLKTEEAVAFEASLQQLDEDVDAARTYWNNNFSYVEISTIDEVKAFLAKAEELEVMVTRLNAQKTGLDNEYVLFVKSIDEADIVLPKDGVNYSLQTAAVADKQTPDGFPIQMGYKSNRGSVLTSAGVMQFERASSHTFYLKDDQSNYMILLGEDAAMLGIPSSDGATEWTGKALGNGKYQIKVAGEDFGGLCLNVLGTKVNSEVVASAKSTEWTIKESELDELQAFLNMMSEESYTDEDLANMDDDEKKKAEAEIVYVFPPKPLIGKVQWKEPIVLPQRPGVIRLVGNLPVPVKEDGEWAKDEHPIEVPDGSHLVLDNINFDDTTAGGDHVIHITGEVTININVTLDDDFLNKWLWFVDLGKGGRLHWHPGGNHRPNIKNDEGYVYIEPGSSTGKIENTGEVSIAENTVVDEIDNQNGGTVNQNGGRVIKIINKYVYVFVGGYIDNCENGTGAHFTMTGGSLGNNDVNHKDVVFVNHGKFIFRGGHIGGYGSHLFHHHRGAYLRIEGGDIDDSHVTHFIEAYDDFYMSGGFKPHKPIVINPGVRIHVINDIKYIWNIQFVGGVLPDLRVPFLVGTKLHPLSLLDWRRIGYRLPAHYRWRFRPAYKFVDSDGEGNDEEIESGALEIADENVEDEDDLQAYLDWLASQGEDTSGTGETTDYDYSDTEDEPAVMNLPEKVLYITKYIYIPVGHHVHFKGGEIRPKVKFNDPIFHVPAGGWMHTTDVVINLLDINSDWTLFNVGGYFHFGKGSWLKGWMPSRGHFYDGAIHGHGINIGKDSHFVLDGGRIDNIVLNLQTHIYLNATLTYNLFINPDASILYKGCQLVKPYLNSFGISIADVALMIHPDRNFAWSLGLDKHGCVALYDRISSFARKYDMSEGWSWMSFGVPAESAFMKSFAKQASDYANSLKRIQDARQELIYDDVLGFVGGLESLVPEVGYHVYANKSFDMNVASDNLLMSEDVTLNIKKGWNWLGYTPQVALPVDVALSSMTPSEGDLVKAYSGGFATYHNGAWVGDLVIQPGEGLMYQANSDASLRYVATRPVVNEYVPASMAKSEWNDDILPVQWSSPVGKYEMNMSIIANVFDQEGNLLNAEDVVIGAFSGGECRGICMGRNRELLFMTVYGDADADELLEFKVYDKVQNLVYDIDEKVAFGNKLVGTVESPQHLTVSSEITPVETITADAQQNDVYSITGIRQNTGRTNLRSLSRGVYIVNGKKVVVK